MKEVKEDINPVIKQKDPFFAKKPNLDFTLLRSKGLKHLGELSGKIWTDHNAHDPGITILETLCYALIDLGYRTTLPIEDLLASGEKDTECKPESSEEKNFFTPLEILTCNPTTITDYRKLLLEVKGVRNAWLEPATIQEVPLFISENQITENNKNYPELTCTASGENAIKLNGLYEVLIQTEPGTNEKKVLEQVREILSAYRNICEDFKDITVLCPIKVGICADVEIEKNTDPSRVYKAIIKTLQAYIAPEIRYYTLKQLLDKGKPIEIIFAGRPVKSDSFGFVDTDELENLPQRKNLYVSDLYQAILSIEGVTAISEISFLPPTSLITHNSLIKGENIQQFRIPKAHVGELDLANTCIQIRSGRGILQVDKAEAVKTLLKSSKTSISNLDLDLSIPEGTSYLELSEYYSIQHDFPLVYGIGEGGLPEEATQHRKAQALQLKCYLLFYDQLLSNYLAQIGNLSALFSLQQESERDPLKRQTYFSQALDNVPGVQKLLQIHAAKDNSEGSLIALPVANNAALNQKLQELNLNPSKELILKDSCGGPKEGLALFADATDTLRDFRMQQVIRNMVRGDYTIEIYEDKAGKFFIFRFTKISEWVFISYQRYRSESEAGEAANFTAFLASIPGYYRKTSHQNGSNKIEFQFELAYNLSAYASYLKFLQENEQLYHQRREAFLDHLLARFANQFTDYSLLRFSSSEQEKQKPKQSVEDKSRFVSFFDEMSRNRGQAFDYFKPSWGTDNVSGFEKRISLLSGMDQWSRRHLCNFEVFPTYRLELPDVHGKSLLRSITPYSSLQERRTAKDQLIKKLRNPENYPDLQNQFIGDQGDKIRRIFSEVATDENIEVSNYQFALQLKDADGEELQKSSKEDYPKEEEAWSGLSGFLNEINQGPDMHLVEIGETTKKFLNSQTLKFHEGKSSKYKWYQYDGKGQKIETAEEDFPDESSAMADFVQKGDYSRFIDLKEASFQWEIMPMEGIPLVGANQFIRESEARLDWVRSGNLGQHEEHYQTESGEEGGIRIVLKNEKGGVLAETQELGNDWTGAEGYIKACCEIFKRETDQVQIRELQGAYGWKFTDTRGSTLMTSLLLFKDIAAAISSMQEAYTSAQSEGNFIAKETSDKSEYRILLRGLNGLFIATTPPPYYISAKKRNAAKRSLPDRIRKIPMPLELKEVASNYRWKLELFDSHETVMEADQTFDSEQEARKDFEENLLKIISEQPQSDLAKQIYTIEAIPIPAAFRFVYFMDFPDETSRPFLISEKEFTSKTEAEDAFTEFISALPEGQVETGESKQRIKTKTDIAAVLINDTQDNRENAGRLLNYVKELYAETGNETNSGTEKWIYRLVDKNNPLAKGNFGSKNKRDAEAKKRELCKFIPHPLDPKKQFIKIICPQLSPDRFHYAVSLQDDDGNDYTIFVSYLGYLSKETAQEAANENWLKIIELASDINNFGEDEENKPISTEEKYSQNMAACEGTNTHVAVIPKCFQPKEGVLPKDKALELAKRFPIRISYKTDPEGNTTKIPEGYIFQVFDLESNRWVWQSKKTFSSIPDAIEAYRLFVVVLGNPDSCRLVCKDGKYEIELVEILAESIEFDTEDEIWDDPIKDENGNLLCQKKGVRLFAQEALSDASFVHLDKEDAYSFMMVDKNYQVARHTCNYHSIEERDSAVDELKTYLTSWEKIDYNLTNDHSKIQYHIGNGYYLESLEDGSGLKEREKEEMVLEWMVYAVVEKNIEPAEEGFLLKNPFKEGDYFAAVKRKGKEEVIKNQFLKLARNYPIFKKDGGYCFHLYYPENGGYFDEELKICGCEEKKESVSENLKFCGRAYILESARCYANLPGALKGFEHFLKLSGKAENIQTFEESGIGPYSFRIIDPDKKMADHPNFHPDKTSALQAASRVRKCLDIQGMHLVEHILLRPKQNNPASCECLLPICPDYGCELTWQEDLEEDDPCAEEENPLLSYIPGADPYSFWATLVLPGWHQRFERTEARHFFRETLYREVPAMVGLNILWLSPRQMCQFESSFKDWIDWYRDPASLCENQDKAVCEVVNCIKEFRNDPLCLIPELAAGDCTCLNSELRKLDECIEESEQLFWSDCSSMSDSDMGTDIGTIKTERLTYDTPLHLGEKASREELKSFLRDPTAIRKLISEREEMYKNHMLKIYDAEVPSSDIFERGRFFVQNPPSLSSYQQLCGEILRLGNDEIKIQYGTFLSVLQNATGYLLDHLVLLNPEHIPDQDKKSLAALLVEINAKGINVQQLVSEWKAKPLQEILGAAVVEKYIELFESF